jgi:lupus La protein
MWKITGGTENKPVPLKQICSFKRMQRFKPYSAVVAALKESTLLLIEGEEGEETIKRKKAYHPESTNQKLRTARTVYVKGFGDEGANTQFDLEAFFAKFGATESVRLRRTEDKLFKGSVFVEFTTEEAAQDFLKLDPKPTWEGHDLLIMSKKAYCEGKEQLIKEGKIQPSTAPRDKFWEGKNGSNDRGRRDRGGFDKNDWKQRRDYDQKNGFNDKRGGGRGRGRGRGGRGGQRDRRDRDDRKDRNGDSGVKKEEAGQAAEATVKSEETKDASAETVSAGTKRGREDGDAGEASEPPAKKVDSKTEVKAES